MNALNKLDHAVDSFCKGILALLFFVMVISALTQVVARTVIGQPQTWTEELCRYCMVWLAMIGSGVAVRTHGHIAVDILKGAVSKNTAEKIELVNMALEIIFAAILLIFGLWLSIRNMGQITPGLKIPMGAVYLCMPFGGLIIIFNVLMHLARRCSGCGEEI